MMKAMQNYVEQIKATEDKAKPSRDVLRSDNFEGLDRKSVV